MAKGNNSEGRKARGKGETKKGVKGPKQKSGRRGPSYRGTTKRARERSPEALDPKVAIIAKDPLRAEILAVAIQRLYSPSEFARDKGISIGVASYAFRVLKDHQIIELVKTEKVRGTVKHMYRANEAAFIGEKDWGALTPILRPGVVGATFGNFNGRVAQAEETGKLYERQDVCIYWAPRDLDETAWKEHAEILAWCIEESQRLEADTVARRANGESDGSFKATVGLFMFPSPTHAEVEAHEREKHRKERKAKGKEAGQRETGMKSRPIHAVVEHDVRLDMLDCLDGQPQTIPQVSDRIGKGERFVTQHMGLLEACGLAERTGDHDENGRPFYVVRLKDQPTWVARAVNDRRQAGTEVTGDTRAADQTTLPQHRPEVIGQVILEVTAELHPRHLTVDELLEKIIGDVEDQREVETVDEAIRLLREIGLLRDRNSEIVEPAPAALCAVALLTT